MKGTLRAVVFDIDGTLINDVSWTLLTDRLGASARDHLALYEGLENGTLRMADAADRLVGIWRATGNATRDRFVKIFRNVPLRPEAKPALRNLARKGYIICLITGSMDLFAEIAAERLGIRHWYAGSSLRWDRRGNLAGLDYEHNQSEKKRAQLIEFCKEQGFWPDACAAVGDGWNDRGLFEATGHGIFYKTAWSDPALARIAWKRIRNLAELKSIL
jgi:HAD superfamily phosphoserine phosphatase-like hydrolase